MLSPRSAAHEAPSWSGIWPEIPIRIAIDPNGNLTQKTENGEVWDYVWNAEDQLVRVCKDLVAPQTCDSDSVAVASFKYDPVGRRIEKKSSGSTQRFAYSGQEVILRADASGEALFVHGPAVDEVMMRESAAGQSFFHADALGSVVAVTDELGGAVQSIRYDAWGVLETADPSAGYAFTGREWDTETGLYYYRARYYEAETGRFLSEDPVRPFGRSVRELNAYAYAANNSVNETDPSGYAIWICNRKAFTKWGPGNHSYFWDDRNGRCCGRGSTLKCKEKGPPEDSCRMIPNSDGRESVLLKCCRRSGDDGAWWPGGKDPGSGNDCHTALDRCLRWNGLMNPGAPGGRVGKPCDPCKDEKKKEPEG